MYALRRFCGLKKNSLFFMDRSSQCHSQNADSPFSLVRSHLSIIPHYRQPITFHKRRFSILIEPFLIDSCQSNNFQVTCIIFGPIRGRYLCFPIPFTTFEPSLPKSTNITIWRHRTNVWPSLGLGVPGVLNHCIALNDISLVSFCKHLTFLSLNRVYVVIHETELLQSVLPLSNLFSSV